MRESSGIMLEKVTPLFDMIYAWYLRGGGSEYPRIVIRGYSILESQGRGRKVSQLEMAV